MVGGAKSYLESNPITARDAQRAPTRPCAQTTPRDPTETEQDLPFSVGVSPEEAQASGGLL